MKMGRRPRCSSVTSRTSFDNRRGKPEWHNAKLVRDAPSSQPCRRPILIATKHLLFGDRTIATIGTVFLQYNESWTLYSHQASSQ